MSRDQPAAPSTPPAPAGIGTQEPAGRPSPLAAAADVVLASGFPTQLALSALLMAAGLMPFDTDGRMSVTYVALLMPADTALLAAFILWRLRAGGGRPAAVLLGGRNAWRESWVGIGLIPVVFAGVVVVMLGLRAAWPWLHTVESNPFEALIRSRRDAVLFIVLVIVTGGLKEELQRAFVLHRFEQSLGGARTGLVLYSAVFGAGHIIQGYDVAIVTTLLGVAWGAVFLRRRSLVAPAVSHAGFNAAQVVQFALFGA